MSIKKIVLTGTYIMSILPGLALLIYVVAYDLSREIPREAIRQELIGKDFLEISFSIVAFMIASFALHVHYCRRWGGKQDEPH